MSTFDHNFKAYRKRGFNADSFVDVGANEGVIAAQLRAALPQAAGAMFEPQPHLKNKLTERSAALKIDYFPYAVGKEDSNITLRFSMKDHFRGGTCAITDDPVAQEWFNEAVEVPLVRLDTMVAQGKIKAPQLLKLDAEGMELDVLEGCQGFMSEVQMVLSEATLYKSLNKHPSFTELCVKMDEYGFVLYDFGQFGYRPHDGALMIVDMVFVRHDNPLRAHQYWG